MQETNINGIEIDDSKAQLMLQKIILREKTNIKQRIH